LTGAGVLMRTFVALQTVDLGFNPHNILVARLPFPKGQYKTASCCPGQLGAIPNPPVANPVFEIVGVISDMKNAGIQDPVRPEIMVPYTVTGAFERGILVRTAGNPIGLLNPVRREIWAVDKNVALTMTRTLDDFQSDFSYAQPRFLLAVLGVFAGVGLVLVAVGVYSVIE
jgi:hypothetical protein